MEKRTILAFLLCLIVVIGFQYYAAQVAPPPRPPAPSPKSAPGGAAAGAAAPGGAPETPEPARAAGPAAAGGDPAPLPVEAERREIALENALVRAAFSTEGAKARSIVLKTIYEDDQKTPLDLLRPYPGTQGAALELSVAPGGERLDGALWPAAEEGRAIRFHYPLAGGVRVEKTVELSPDGYHFDVILRFLNDGAQPAAIGYTLWAADGITPDDPHAPLHAVAGVEAGTQVDFVTLDVSKVPRAGAAERQEWASSTFGGIASKYFAIVLVPRTPEARPTLFVEQVAGPLDPATKERPLNLRAGYRVRQANVPAGGEVVHRYLLYAGPKDSKVLGRYETLDGRPIGLPRVVDLTSVVPLAESLAKLFLSILHGFHAVVGSYGIAIILLTLMVRIFLHPLSRASQRSMYKMQKLAPLVKKIQEKYKDKKTKEAAQKMNVEIMELYKAHGANPIAGCLPTFLQLPVFIGLYNALAYSIELRQTHFLWIDDLTKPDRLLPLPLPFQLPWPLENYLNVLPILMVATMIVQQKMQPTPADPQQQQQARIMGFMMVLFGFLFYTVPSGLVLYFFTSSLLGILEQRWVRRQLEREEALGKLRPA